MANYAVTKTGGFGRQMNYREFLVDTKDGIATLPNLGVVAVGSKAYCAEDGNTYVLSNAGEWVVKPSGSGGGGGGGSGSGGVFVVTIEETGEAGFYKASATYAEIVAAAEAGQVCMARATDANGWQVFLALTAYSNDSSTGNEGVVYFGHTAYGGAMDTTGIYAYALEVEITSSDRITVHTGKFRGIELTS